VLLIAATCSACGTLHQPLAVSVTPPPPLLPSPPAGFGVPVDVDPPKEGEDARAYSARERRGRLINAERLESDRQFYQDVRQAFTAPAPSEQETVNDNH